MPTSLQNFSAIFPAHQGLHLFNYKIMTAFTSLMVIESNLPVRAAELKRVSPIALSQPWQRQDTISVIGRWETKAQIKIKLWESFACRHFLMQKRTFTILHRFLALSSFLSVTSSQQNHSMYHQHGSETHQKGWALETHKSWKSLPNSWKPKHYGIMDLLQTSGLHSQQVDGAIPVRTLCIDSTIILSPLLL